MTAPPNTRRTARLSTVLRVLDATDPDAGPWKTRDLSTTGLFLLAPGRWETGDEAMLIVEHGETRLPVRARVTQATAEGVGFELLEPTTELEGAVLEIMSERFAAGDGAADRRREVRYAADLPVVWRAEEAGEFRARVRNLSPAGAALLSAVKPRADAIIYVLFPLFEPTGAALPYRALMGARSRVVEPIDDGFGLEFLEPSEAFSENLVRLLARG